MLPVINARMLAAAPHSQALSMTRHRRFCHGATAMPNSFEFGSANGSVTWSHFVLGFASLTVSAYVRRTHSGKLRHRFRRFRRFRQTVLAANESSDGAFDPDKIDEYNLAELEEIYIDALWSYHRSGVPVLQDNAFDKLKQQLYRLDSRFPTLKRQEVAFVEASIAFYRGEPVVSDDEYEALKAQVKESGKRKDVTAFLLYERGERLLTSSQFNSLKDECEKIGLTAVDLDQCNLAQLEEMYVDALWAYYHDGVQLLNDAQYDKLKQELAWQASGFPTLRRYEIDFVKASLSYWQGKPLFSDEEWKNLKQKVLADGKRQDVTAFLLYSKGQDVLEPAKFQQMADELARIGFKVKRADSRARDATLSVDSIRFREDILEVIGMIFALSFFPVVICTSIFWSLGIFLDLEFVPDPSWAALLSAEAIPIFTLGSIAGLGITWRLFEFLDLQYPRILVGTCPSCQAEVRIFSGGANPAEIVETACKSCGCEMKINTVQNRIEQAGLGAQVVSDASTSGMFDWKKTWEALKQQARPLMGSDRR